MLTVVRSSRLITGSDAARRVLDPWFLCAALLALIPILAIARPGMPLTADGEVHLLRTLEAAHLLREGVLYPRWAPDFYLGYGYPFFNFYAPGAHLLGALLALGGLGVARAVVAVQVLALLLYPTGAYLAARALFGRHDGPDVRLVALASAALYLYAPLRARELFVQGNLSQLLALGLLPWCAWALTIAARWASARWAVASGFLLAALLYAHHATAFVAFPLLGLYTLAIALIATTGPRRAAPAVHIAAVAGAFVLAASLSAPFWLPSIVELRDVNIRSIEAGMFNVRLNLLPLRELLAPAAILDGGALNPPMPNSIGLAQWGLAALGSVAAILHLAATLRMGSGAWRTKNEAELSAAHAASFKSLREPQSPLAVGWTRAQSAGALLAVATLFVLSVGLILPVAAPVWEAIPLARFIAFPWRLLGPALLWAALLGGAALWLVPARLRLAATVALLLLAPLSIAPYLFPRPFAPAPEPGLDAIMAYELSGGARATASANEYLPRWVQDPNPPLLPARAYEEGRRPDRLDRETLPPGSRAEQVYTSGLEDRFHVDLSQPGIVQVRRFYFPGWQAWVDGEPAAVEPRGPFGLIGVAVPAGAHEVRLRFGTTAPRTAGSLLALAGLVGSLLVLWRARVADGDGRSRAGGEPAGMDAGRGFEAGGAAVVTIAVVILVMTGVKTLLIEPLTGWFRHTSAVEAPAGMQHALHIPFRNGIELIGYDLAEPVVRQGGQLRVRLYWRALRAGLADARPFLHLDAPTGELTWANQTKIHFADKPSSDWPTGFFVVDDYTLSVPPDTPPVLAALRAGMLDENGSRVDVANGDANQVTLGQVRIVEARRLPSSLPPGHEKAYRLGDTIRLLGASARPAPEDEGLDLTLYWQATDLVQADYTVFVHVLDESGQMIAQGDGPPVNGWYPTSAWLPRQVVEERRRVHLPPDTDTRALRVVVGLYTPADGTRVPIFMAEGERIPNDGIVLPVDEG